MSLEWILKDGPPWLMTNHQNTISIMWSSMDSTYLRLWHIYQSSLIVGDRLYNKTKSFEIILSFIIVVFNAFILLFFSIFNIHFAQSS